MAKATNWRGTTSTDANTSANWSNGVWAAGDTVHVLSTATYPMQLNVQPKFNLAFLQIDQDCTVDFGSVNTPVALNATKMVDYGSGNTYFDSADSGGVLNTALLIIAKPNGLFMFLDSTSNSMYYDRIDALSGNVNTANASLLLCTEMNIGYVNFPATDLQMVALNHGFSTTNTFMNAGYIDGVSQLNLFGNLVMSGGYMKNSTLSGTIRHEGGVIDTCQMTGATLRGLGGILNVGSGITVATPYYYPGYKIIDDPISSRLTVSGTAHTIGVN